MLSKQTKNKKRIYSSRLFHLMARAAFGFLLIPFVYTFAQVEQVLDHEVTQAIETKLWNDEVIDANTIDVETRDGIVTLEGTTDNILTKERVEKIAETIKGVRAVVNEVEVIPLITTTDSELKTSVEKALLDDPATESFEVSVEVRNGLVTLSGTVDSWQERNLCIKVAKGVRGVRGVSSDIDVEYLGQRPDKEIEQEIERRLAYDVRVDDYLIDVDVSNGEVELSGSVGSLAEKRLTAADAWVRGVKDVDSENLDIEWWARDDMRRKELFVTLSDEETERAVRDAFLYDPRVKSYHVEVDANDGRVTLTGTVDNLEAKLAATKDAQNTVGVWSVENHLKVKPLKIPADDDLESRVGLALITDPYVERTDVEIEARDGWVYLSGQVNSSFEKYQAERVAEGVKGTVLVVNNIDSEYTWEWKPDREIKADVEDELYWSLFVDSDQVDVSVEDGVVTLQGTVDTTAEKRQAENGAWEAGAKDVRNKLAAKYQADGPEPDFWRGFPTY